jgi:hypothetical protein
MVYITKKTRVIFRMEDGKVIKRKSREEKKCIIFITC